MISGALLQAYCPDNGQCDTNAAGTGGALRRLLEAAAAAAGGAPAEGQPTCDGRSLWTIVGCITLSSPLLVLLTQVGVGVAVQG